jgi:hypothetical protein
MGKRKILEQYDSVNGFRKTWIHRKDEGAELFEEALQRGNKAVLLLPVAAGIGAAHGMMCVLFLRAEPIIYNQ